VNGGNRRRHHHQLLPKNMASSAAREVPLDDVDSYVTIRNDGRSLLNKCLMNLEFQSLGF